MKASLEQVHMLRQMLKDASDDELETFLGIYSLAAVAEMLIKAMPEDAREGFFIAMRTEYPRYFGEKSAP